MTQKYWRAAKNSLNKRGANRLFIWISPDVKINLGLERRFRSSLTFSWCADNHQGLGDDGLDWDWLVLLSRPHLPAEDVHFIVSRLFQGC